MSTINYLVLGLVLASALHRCEGLVKVPLRGVLTPEIGEYGTMRHNYFLEIGVGNPEHLFRVQIDTSQSHLWVPHFERFKMNPYLHYSQGFRCSKSRTCKKIEKNIKMNLSSVNMVCELMDDQLLIHGLAGPVNGLKFAAVTNIDKDLSVYPVDGYLGLGPERTTLRGYPSLLVSMQMSHKIDLLKFGLWFHPSGQYGELTLGGEDADRIVQPQRWFRSLSGRSWTLNLQSVAYGSFVFGCPTRNCRVDLDTSNNGIYGPAREVAALYQNLGARLEENIAYVECRLIAQIEPLRFEIEGIAYTLMPSNFIKQLSTTRCFVSVFFNNEANVWTLGTDFLSSYYTSFDVTNSMISISGTRA